MHHTFSEGINPYNRYIGRYNRYFQGCGRLPQFIKKRQDHFFLSGPLIPWVTIFRLSGLNVLRLNRQTNGHPAGGTEWLLLSTWNKSADIRIALFPEACHCHFVTLNLWRELFIFLWNKSAHRVFQEEYRKCYL